MPEDALAYLVAKYKLDLAQPSPFWVKCNRNTALPDMFHELGFTRGAEIGVLRGQFSERLCQANPAMTVFSIDSWAYYPVRKNFRKAWMYEPLYREAVARLAPYPNNRIIRKWSLEAVKDFADASLDFIFIDADHRFQAITNDIAEWGRKVRPGGIICGHDFERNRGRVTEFVHVRAVVEAWTASYHIHPWLVLDDPLERGWLWVKT